MARIFSLCFRSSPSHPLGVSVWPKDGILVLVISTVEYDGPMVGYPLDTKSHLNLNTPDMMGGAEKEADKGEIRTRAPFETTDCD